MAVVMVVVGGGRSGGSRGGDDGGDGSGGGDGGCGSGSRRTAVVTQFHQLFQ